MLDKFINSLPNDNKQYILFVAKDSMGNEYYVYQEIEPEKIKLYLHNLKNPQNQDNDYNN